MRFVVTDDAGFEAAKTACKTTGEITEIDVKDATVFVCKMDYFPVDTTTEEIASGLENALKRLAPGSPIMCVVGGQNFDLSLLSDSQMRRYGWVRIKK